MFQAGLARAGKRHRRQVPTIIPNLSSRLGVSLSIGDHRNMRKGGTRDDCLLMIVMAPVVRTATASAKPSTIWQTCFVPMQWQDWDVDIKTVEDVQCDSCQEGGTCVIVMKDSEIRAKTTLFNVEKNQSLTYSGAFYGGLVAFQGDFLLEPDGPQKTKITYTFEMKGILGAIVGWLKSEWIAHGTEKGLENIVRLSEAAETQ